LRVVGVGFYCINRIIVCSWAGKAVKDMIIYLGDGIVTDGQDSAIAEQPITVNDYFQSACSSSSSLDLWFTKDLTQQAKQVL
jgi:hypothetical protein